MTVSVPAAVPAAAPEIRHRSFRLHVVIFAIVIALLGAIDWYTAEPYWIHWIFLGWGAGIGLHYRLAYRH